MNKIWLLLLVATSCHAMETLQLTKIPPSSVRSPESWGEVNLYHFNNGFVVEVSGKKTLVERFSMDLMLQNVCHSKEMMNKSIEGSYIRVNRAGNGEFYLTHHVRGLGGGPGLAVGVAGSSAGSIAILTAISVAFPPSAAVCLPTAAMIAALTPITTGISLFLGPL